MTRASLVIPTRGGRRRLPRLFEALTAQDHDDLEIIVVVDGDVDGTAALASQWSSRLPLTVLVLPENRGRSVALNTGFGAAGGEVLIRCDDDLEPGPSHVARHVAHHELAAEPIGVIGLCPNVLPDTAYARVYGRRREVLFRREAFAMPARDRWRLWGANVSVTRRTWSDIGGYDTAYRAYGLEDVDWGYRLHRAGHPIVLDPSLDAAHWGAATTTEVRALRAFHSGAARATFERLHGTGPLGVSGRPRGVWGRSTAVLGRGMGPDGVGRLARAVDAVADRLPGPMAEKAVALVVESAAIAGQSRPWATDQGI